VYVSRRSVFFEHKQIVGTDMRGYVMPPERSVDINTEMDIAFVEFLLERAERGAARPAESSGLAAS
jgi:CMP-N-acetylneuraminic acid synthetase